MGDGVKRIEDNEIDPAIIQRRSLHVARDLPRGHVLSVADWVPLRPAPAESIPPYRSSELCGKVLTVDKTEGEFLTWSDVGMNHA
jgi:sialic acid synthase SpsE